jgi:aldose 1-epimerase
MSSDMLTLRAGDASIAVCHDGGRLASLRVGDLEILVTEGDTPSRWGSFPMVPWCGRLDGGRLSVHGESHDFPLTRPPHALHGLAHMRPWRAVDANTLRTDLLEPWPFPAHVLQRFELLADALTVTLEVHAERVPMPAMAGWHPWFRRRLARGQPAHLSFEAAAAYVLDDTMIPTGELLPPPAPPWDRCFRDVVKGPRIDWPGALSLALSSTFDHWVVFTEPEHALCVEPQSGPPNEPNMSPRMVHPGAPLVGSMTLRWKRG